MPATIVSGDIFDAQVDIIVHQTNCVTRKPHGFSEEIAKKWPHANIYGLRNGSTPNTAYTSDEGVPGTCTLLKTNVHKPSQVACLLAQICPGNGKSDYWCRRYGKMFVDDTVSKRAEYFRQALSDLAEKIIKISDDDEKKDRVVAFPFRIACGLAGGSWNVYEPMIHVFADNISGHGWKTHIYRHK